MEPEFDQDHRSDLQDLQDVGAWCWLLIGFAVFVATVATVSAVSGVVL